MATPESCGSGVCISVRKVHALRALQPITMRLAATASAVLRPICRAWTCDGESCRSNAHAWANRHAVPIRRFMAAGSGDPSGSSPSACNALVFRGFCVVSEKGTVAKTREVVSWHWVCSAYSLGDRRRGLDSSRPIRFSENSLPSKGRNSAGDGMNVEATQRTNSWMWCLSDGNHK
jgi:hypothetical protein